MEPKSEVVWPAAVVVPVAPMDADMADAKEKATDCCAVEATGWLTAGEAASPVVSLAKLNTGCAGLAAGAADAEGGANGLDIDACKEGSGNIITETHQACPRSGVHRLLRLSCALLLVDMRRTYM